MILSIDPGIRIGVALFQESGKEHDRYVIDWQDLQVLLTVDDNELWWGSTTHITKVIIEDFVNDPKRGARGGQHNDASEVIGAVRILAGQADVPFVRQQASCLSAAKLWAGYTQKQKHLPDEDSAYLHGFFYLVKNKVLQPVPLC